MIKHNITAMDYTGICLHCKCELKTDKEKGQGYCEECWGNIQMKWMQSMGVRIRRENEIR